MSAILETEEQACDHKWRGALCVRCWIERTLKPRQERPIASDVPVEAQHADIHALLIRWAAWVKQRGTRTSLASIERLYSKGGGTPPSTAPLGTDPEIMNMDRAVMRMPEQHRTTIIRYYIYGWAPATITRHLRMRPENWGAWIGTCRSMARNILRRLVVAPLHAVGVRSRLTQPT